jgi:acyl-ACP thioesterase
MPNKNHTFNTQFRIRSYEVGPNQQTGITTIANLFQEAAGLHAKKLKFDITDLLDVGLTWVLYKLHIRIFEFPKRWQNVAVKTWPSTGKDIRAFRSYEMTNNDGKLLAVALGQWMVLDSKKRRPRKLPDQLSQYPLLKQKDYELDSGKNYIKPVLDTNKTMIATVGKYDLDMNNHVNSVKYIEWSAGYISEKSDLDSTEILIQHQAEAHYGDKIYKAVEDAGSNKRKISLFKEDGSSLSTAIITYT